MNSIAEPLYYAYGWVKPESTTKLSTQLSKAQSTLQSATALYVPNDPTSCFVWFEAIHSALAQIQHVFMSKAENDCVKIAVSNYRTKLNGFFSAYEEHVRFTDAETHIACANILADHYKELLGILEKCDTGENIHPKDFCVLQDAAIEVRVLRDNLFLNYDPIWAEANQKFSEFVITL